MHTPGGVPSAAPRRVESILGNRTRRKVLNGADVFLLQNTQITWERVFRGSSYSGWGQRDSEAVSAWYDVKGQRTYLG